MNFASSLAASAAVLFGQANPWEQKVAQLRANSAGMGQGLMWTALVFVLAVAVGLVIRNRLQKLRERVVDDSRKLFRDLCRAQRLTWKESALLEDLAERRGLESPSLLFVREDYFDGDDEGIDEKTRRDANALRERLFA